MPASLPLSFRSLLAIWLAFALLLFPAARTAQAAPAAPVQEKQYVLKYGDAINMGVVGNEKLAIEKQPIRPDGLISLPLIGEVQAGGLTVPQFQERVTKAYTRFFTDPQIVINVAIFRPIQIAVLGMVNKPGTYPVAEPTRLLQMLALAGGLIHERASLNNVLVLRSSGDRQIIDLNAVLEGRTADNVMLYDGDAVRVEEVFGPDWYRILPPLASSLSILSTIIILLTRK
jgi:polysaccharide export outer membrane protein